MQKDTPRRSPRRRRGTSALPDARPSPGLFERILDVPHLARVVPHLQPQLLHRVIQHCGLEDCGELVALATPGQLAAVFDLDLWRADQAGLDEQFDPDRFGVWLEVLLEAGGALAARTLADIDGNLVTAALAHHVLVFDPAAVPDAESTDGDEMPGSGTPYEGLRSAVGGYLVVGKRTDSWNAVVAVLSSLAAGQPDYFHRVMQGCRSLSSSVPEVDGLDDLLPAAEQVMFDVAFTREQRREQQGYVTPAQARAFLEMARQVRLGHDSGPPGNPVASAYFRAIDWTPAEDAKGGSRRLPAASTEPSASHDSAEGVTTIVELLFDAGILPQPPRLLLDGPQGRAPRLARIQALMQSAGDRDPAAASVRGQELAFLANTIAAGCSLEARPFTPQEASDAAVATCNLGLENWPSHWLPASGPAEGRTSGPPERHRSGPPDRRPLHGTLPDDFLVDHDLVSVFQVGWTVLHNDVCLFTAEQLIGVLTRLPCDDRALHLRLHALRFGMTKQWRARTPWRARDALDVIASLDMPAWAALLGLIGECPVIHAALGASLKPGTGAISAEAFDFVSENSQIASVREFMRALPNALRQ